MKEDRRKQRTRSQLRDALIALILEKGYDNVTVQDITDRANLGRATFYLHYPDKEQLLLSSLREMLETFKAQMGPLTRETLLDDPTWRVLPFKHVVENQNFYRVTLLSDQGMAGVLKTIRAQLIENTRTRLAVVIPPEQSPIPLEMVASYLVGAMFALMAWWLQHDMPQSPEEMAELYFRMTRSVVMGLFAPYP